MNTVTIILYTLSHLVFMLRALYVVFRYFTPKFKNLAEQDKVMLSATQPV